MSSAMIDVIHQPSGASFVLIGLFDVSDVFICEFLRGEMLYLLRKVLVFL